MQKLQMILSNAMVMLLPAALLWASAISAMICMAYRLYGYALLSAIIAALVLYVWLSAMQIINQ